MYSDCNQVLHISLSPPLPHRLSLIYLNWTLDTWKKSLPYKYEYIFLDQNLLKNKPENPFQTVTSQIFDYAVTM